LVLGVGVALFPSNYEIRGMEDDEAEPSSSEAAIKHATDEEGLGEGA
jgi:hypothetical protein